jgi:hypothetical protein
MAHDGDLQFRLADSADAEAIAALHADSWRRHYRGAYSACRSWAQAPGCRLTAAGAYGPSRDRSPNGVVPVGAPTERRRSGLLRGSGRQMCRASPDLASRRSRQPTQGLASEAAIRMD